VNTIEVGCRQDKNTTTYVENRGTSSPIVTDHNEATQVTRVIGCCQNDNTVNVNLGGSVALAGPASFATRVTQNENKIYCSGSGNVEVKQQQSLIQHFHIYGPVDLGK
jgi:hypothetical protein